MDESKKTDKGTGRIHVSHHGEKSAPHSEEHPKEETITLSLKEYEELKAQLEKSRNDCGSNLDGWQRERAEFSNYKKRIDREQDQLSQSITGSIIKKYLVILDDLELALKSRPTNKEGAAWAKGIELIARKIQSIVEGEGIERIAEARVQFDPNHHEAITHEEAPGFESGEVIEVIRPGYKLGERILRPAMVRVAK